MQRKINRQLATSIKFLIVFPIIGLRSSMAIRVKHKEESRKKLSK